ncbi:MAG: hypothetical protein M0C28_24335 [Candidatus Moduliflexus flocculans]|nr:hypothetical protein [Candidatus Moduliflexus flocculans]
MKTQVSNSTLLRRSSSLRRRPSNGPEARERHHPGAEGDPRQEEARPGPDLLYRPADQAPCQEAYSARGAPQAARGDRGIISHRPDRLPHQGNVRESTSTEFFTPSSRSR